MILNILLAVQEGVTGTTIIQMIAGVIKYVLLFNSSLDIGLSEPGMICEEIYHLGGISQILEVHNGVYTHVLEVLESFTLKTKQVSFFF